VQGIAYWVHNNDDLGAKFKVRRQTGLGLVTIDDASAHEKGIDDVWPCRSIMEKEKFKLSDYLRNKTRRKENRIRFKYHLGQ